MKKKISAVALALGLVLPFFCWSQNSKFGNWLMYFGNKTIDSKWNLHHEIQYRNYNALGDLEQLLLRTGLGYTFNNGTANALLGYGFILSENYIENSNDKTSVNEHRIYQQFISKQTLGPVKLSHRYRLEQRFVESYFKMRFRYFLGLHVPLYENQDGERKLYLSAYNETFLNTETPVFDRNRLYGGIGHNISQNIRIEAGYMNQFFESRGRDQFNVMTFVNF